MRVCVSAAIQAINDFEDKPLSSVSDLYAFSPTSNPFPPFVLYFKQLLQGHRFCF